MQHQLIATSTPHPPPKRFQPLAKFAQHRPPSMISLTSNPKATAGRRPARSRSSRRRRTPSRCKATGSTASRWPPGRCASRPTATKTSWGGRSSPAAPCRRRRAFPPSGARNGGKDAPKVGRGVRRACAGVLSPTSLGHCWREMALIFESPVPLIPLSVGDNVWPCSHGTRVGDTAGCSELR